MTLCQGYYFKIEEIIVTYKQNTSKIEEAFSINFVDAQHMSYKLSNSEVHLWYIPFNRDQICRNYLSHDELRLEREFVFKFHREKFVYYRTALRFVLSFYLNKKPENIVFKYGQYGKPELDERSAFIGFNLSHSGELGLIALAGSGDVGVDIELIKPINDMDEIVTQHFSFYEESIFKACPAQDKLFHFYRLWTCKEAYVKTLGAGLHYPLDRFSITFCKAGFPTILENSSLDKKKRLFFIKSRNFIYNSDIYAISCAATRHHEIVRQYWIK